MIDIGCLECQAPSDLKAVTDEAGARAMGAKLREEMGDRWGGDGVLVAFPLPEDDD